MNRPTLAVAALAAALTLAATFTPGCSTRFPYGASWDRHNFVSTVHQPVTVELLDTVTKEVVWRLDVPVNKMAVVDLEHASDWNASLEGHSPAYKIAWKVMDVNTKVNYLDQRQALSGNPVLLRHALRDAPEMPQDPDSAQPLGGKYDPRPL